MKKYLAQHAEPEMHDLDSFPTETPYQHVVCIPAFRETPDFLARLITLANQQSSCILLVLVINQPDDYLNTDCNRQIIDACESGEQIWASDNDRQKLHALRKLHCLSVHRYKEDLRIPKKQGVGLARKIACDLAASLIARGMIDDTKIFSTDADTHLPNDYFTTEIPPQHSAAVFPFTHRRANDSTLNDATQLYEKSLHAYVDGLKSAGSPYAYHTIGSCLLIDALSYCKVRGFPKRSGAEDFYLLNKLQKYLPVYSLDAPPLQIESRLSSRVPFGTGPATADLIAGRKTPESLFYTEKSYHFLSIWLRYLDFLMAENTDNTMDTFTQQRQPRISSIDQRQLLTLANFFSLDAITKKIITNFKQYRQRQKAIHDWFDAFKTLKLIRLYNPLIVGTSGSASSSTAISGINDKIQAE